MGKILSNQGIEYILTTIRNFLLEYPYKNISNVTFMNEYSFYLYMKNQNLGNSTLENIMQKIEDCIPITLTDKTHELFISSFNSKSDEEANIILERLKDECKAEFLREIRLVKSDIQWKNLTELCKKIREENYNFYFILKKI